METSRVGAAVIGILGIIVGLAVAVGAERAGLLHLALQSAGLADTGAMIAEAAVRSREAELEAELGVARQKVDDLENVAGDLRAERARAEEVRRSAARLADEAEGLRVERDRLEAELLVERERRRAIETWAAAKGSPEIPAPARAIAASVVAARPDLGVVVIDRGRARGVAPGQEFGIVPGADAPRSARIIIDEVREEIAIGQVVPASAAAAVRPGSGLVEQAP
jgi:hypothetical protein